MIGGLKKRDRTEYSPILMLFDPLLIDWLIMTVRLIITCTGEEQRHIDVVSEIDYLRRYLIMLGNGPVIEERTLSDPISFWIRDIVRMPFPQTVRTLDHLPKFLYPHLTQEITQFLRIVRRKLGLTLLDTRLQPPLVADLTTESGQRQNIMKVIITLRVG